MIRKSTSLSRQEPRRSAPTSGNSRSRFCNTGTSRAESIRRLGRSPALAQRSPSAPRPRERSCPGATAHSADHFPGNCFSTRKLPWFHPLERRFQKLSKSGFPWIAAATASALGRSRLLASLTLASCFVTRRARSDHGNGSMRSALTSVWFAPIPFTRVAILSGVPAGIRNRKRAQHLRALDRALLGYCAHASVPFLPHALLPRFRDPSWLPKRLGLRRFPATISVLDGSQNHAALEDRLSGTLLRSDPVVRDESALDPAVGALYASATFHANPRHVGQRPGSSAPLRKSCSR